MKKIKYICIICLFSAKSFGQEVKISTKLSNTLSGLISNDYLAIYNGTDLGIGIQMNTPKGNFGAKLLYHFEGSLVTNGLRPYVMRNQFIGGELNYRILNDNKKISPILGVICLTEIASNYRGKYILNNGPVNHYMPGGVISSYYVSTPIIGSVYLGSDFRLLKDFYFYVALGYGNRYMKTKYKASEFSDPDLSDRHSLKGSKMIHFVDFKFGLTYAISTKKSTK